MLQVASTSLGPFMPWVESGGFGANLGEGVGFFALGLVGALVTIYLFLGEWLPSMGGKAEYETLQIEVEDLGERREVLLALREEFAGGTGALAEDRRDEARLLSEEIQTEIESKSARAQQLRDQMFRQGLLLYAFLGGTFAVLFAETLIQALLIGFGWTAVADRLGLKREEAEKATRRAREIEKLKRAAEEGSDASEELKAIRAALVEASEAAQRLYREKDALPPTDEPPDLESNTDKDSGK